MQKNCSLKSLPVILKFLNNDNEIINAVPGEIFNMLEDELETETDSTLFIAICNESLLPYVLLTYQLTDGTIQIAGKSEKLISCSCKQIATEYPATATVQVNLLNCPPRVSL